MTSSLHSQCRVVCSTFANRYTHFASTLNIQLHWGTSSLCNSTQTRPNSLLERGAKPGGQKNRRHVKGNSSRNSTRDVTIGQKSALSDSEQDTKSCRKSKNHNSVTPPSLSFPFDGKVYTQVDDEFFSDMPRPRDSSNIHVVDNTLSADRFYRISSGGASVVYPSVTTILSNTITTPQYYRLRNWKRSMIKAYGEEGFQNIRKQTIDTGTHFHKVRVYMCMCLLGVHL